MTRLMLRMTTTIGIVVSILTGMLVLIGKTLDKDMLWVIFESSPSTRQDFGAADVLHGVDLERGVTIDIIPPQDGYNSIEFYESWERVFVLDATPDTFASEYGIYTFNPQSNTTTPVYVGTAEYYTQPQGIYEYSLTPNHYPIPTHFTLVDPTTYDVYIIDAETYERRHVYTLTDQDDNIRYTRFVPWSPSGDQIALFDGDNTLIIMDIHGNMLAQVTLSDQQLNMGWVYWIDDDHLYIAMFFQSSGNAIAIVNVPTEDIVYLEPNATRPSLTQGCESLLYQVLPEPGTSLISYYRIDITSGDVALLDAVAPDGQANWEWVQLNAGCNRILFVTEGERPPGFVRAPDTRGRALQWEDVLITDVDGNTLTFLDSVGNFRRARDDAAFTYVIPGAEPDTYDFMIADWDTPDQPERIAILPQITAAFTWHEDANIITYIEPNSVPESSLVVYDLKAGREVYRTDDRYTINNSNYRLVP